jgi:hypothetical protein
MAETQTSHDQLFKQVLGEFFPEFIELFFPQVAAYLDRDSIEFLPLELFADLVSGDAFETEFNCEGAVSEAGIVFHYPYRASGKVWEGL